jgi:hypothetical protein
MPVQPSGILVKLPATPALVLVTEFGICLSPSYCLSISAFIASSMPLTLS